MGEVDKANDNRLEEIFDIDQVKRLIGLLKFGENPILVLDNNARVVLSVGKYPFFCQIVRSDNSGMKMCDGFLRNVVNSLSQKKKEISIRCPSGLLGIGAPLMLDGKMLGGILVGALLDEQLVEEDLKNVADSTNIGKDELVDEIKKLSVVEEKQIHKIGSFVEMLAKLIPLLSRESMIVKRQIRQMTALHELTNTLNSSLEIKDIAEFTLSFLTANFRIHNSSINILEDKSCFVANDNARNLLSNVEEVLIREVSKQKSFLRVNDLSKDFLFDKIGGIGQIGYSVISFPLLSGGTVQGLLNLYFTPGCVSDQEIELLGVISHHLALIVQNSLMFSRTRESSLKDRLTGLYNRRYFNEFFRKELSRSKRYNSATSIMLFDVDDFKHYNDANGHLDGDELLVNIAEITRNSIREADCAFRYGGEEFVVILPQTNSEEAIVVGERLRKSVSLYDFKNKEKQPKGVVSVSVGVVSCMNSSMSETEMVDMADKAMYEAKQRGKNTVVSKIVVDKNLSTIDPDEVSGKKKGNI